MNTRFLNYLVFFVFFISCNTHDNGTSGNAVIIKPRHVPSERSSVSAAAVKTYSEVIKSFETTDTFKVALYETKQTFKYLIKIHYKQLDAEDTLRIPDFGINPMVDVKKGEKRPSCIIGFFDEHKQFRESKMVSFEENEIKVHVLKHYAVATYQDTVK